MKKLITIIILLAVVGSAGGWYYMRKNTKDPEVRTAQISRGDIVKVVQATGTLEAVTTVQVGTQVGGIIQNLYADFNDFVKKGQVIARLDPTIMSTVYKLDGTPTKVTMGQGEATVTAKWDGAKLVITTKTEQGENTQTWSLANGVLTIDRTGGRGPSTTTYKKST